MGDPTVPKESMFDSYNGFCLCSRKCQLADERTISNIEKGHKTNGKFLIAMKSEFNSSMEPKFDF